MKRFWFIKETDRKSWHMNSPASTVNEHFLQRLSKWHLELGPEMTKKLKELLDEQLRGLLTMIEEERSSIHSEW